MAEDDIVKGENNPTEPEITNDAEREIEDLEVPSGGGGTLSDEESGVQHKTDLQAILSYLHQHYADKRQDELLQSAASSRIFPDNYLDKNFFLSMSFIEEHEGEDDIDVTGIINRVQDATSRGYEGRQRAEDLELAGAAHEEEMEKLSKELGLGS